MPQTALPSEESISHLLDILDPTCTSFRIEPLAGSFSNFTNLVILDADCALPQQIVIRRYNEENGDCIGKATREYKALEVLHGGHISVPRPLYLDAEGDVLGSAGIVTEFVPGTLMLAAEEPERWASKADEIATQLARIHQTHYDAAIKAVMMDGNKEVSWFTQSDRVPSYMQAHPDGEMVWHLVRDLLPHIDRVAPSLLHIDYWSGNILWYENRISAIVDWEEVAFGDGGVDVAYCLMEYYLEGQDAAAERFLSTYEAQIGRPVANLGIWALAASVRPMLDLEGWLTRPQMDERFRRFIARAREWATN